MLHLGRFGRSPSLLPALLLAAALSGGCLRNAEPVDLSDAAITARLQTGFGKRPDLKPEYLDFEVHGGIVSITGIVTSYEDKRFLVETAQRIKGVREVLDSIVIRP